jgi:hypothetical protein
MSRLRKWSVKLLTCNSWFVAVTSSVLTGSGRGRGAEESGRASIFNQLKSCTPESGVQEVPS